MFSTLPDFSPRDSHSLWYTPSRGPVQLPPHLEVRLNDPPGNNGVSHQARQRAQIYERTALARLAADEKNLLRRRQNVQNFGTGWLRPPGVPKTLKQIREEKREQEEHQEALRREQLAQELAEAEAAHVPDDGVMDDVQLDGAQDLDDEIPDADDDNYFDIDDDDEEEDEVDDGSDVEDEEDDGEAMRAEMQNNLITARMRMTDDAFREALARGDHEGDDMYGSEEELEEEGQGHMLDEEDLAHEDMDGMADDGGMGMDADLDDEIPEAESGGGYEHTDSDAELTSSDNQDQDSDEDSDDDDDGAHGIGFVPRSASLAPPLSPTAQAGRSSLAPGRESMDLSNLLSQDESSYMASSPAQMRRGRAT